MFLMLDIDEMKNWATWGRDVVEVGVELGWERHACAISDGNWFKALWLLVWVGYNVRQEQISRGSSGKQGQNGL